MDILSGTKTLHTCSVAHSYFKNNVLAATTLLFYYVTKIAQIFPKCQYPQHLMNTLHKIDRDLSCI
jgi:hypothetical protein